MRPIYYIIILHILLCKIASAQSHNYNLLPYKVGSSWGYADSNGILKIPAQFESVLLFSNVVAGAKTNFVHALATLKHRNVIIDKMGNRPFGDGACHGTYILRGEKVLWEFSSYQEKTQRNWIVLTDYGGNIIRRIDNASIADVFSTQMLIQRQAQMDSIIDFFSVYQSDGISILYDNKGQRLSPDKSYRNILGSYKGKIYASDGKFTYSFKNKKRHKKVANYSFSYLNSKSGFGIVYKNKGSAIAHIKKGLTTPFNYYSLLPYKTFYRGNDTLGTNYFLTQNGTVLDSFGRDKDSRYFILDSLAFIERDSTFFVYNTNGQKIDSFCSYRSMPYFNLAENSWSFHNKNNKKRVFFYKKGRITELPYVLSKPFILAASTPPFRHKTFENVFLTASPHSGQILVHADFTPVVDGMENIIVKKSSIERPFFMFKKAGKWGLCDTLFQVLIEPHLDTLYWRHNGFDKHELIAQKEGKFGVLNPNGIWKIEAILDNDNFLCDRKKGYTIGQKNEKLFVLTPLDSLIILPGWAEPEYGGYGILRISNEYGKSAIVNKHGNIFIGKNINEYDNEVVIRNFDDITTYYDSETKEIIETKNNNSPSPEYFVYKKNEAKGQIDTIEIIRRLSFQEGIAIAEIEEYRYSYRALVDTNRFIIDTIRGLVSDFSHNTAIIQHSGTGLINKKGKVLIEKKYHSVSKINAYLVSALKNFRGNNIYNMQGQLLYPDHVVLWNMEGESKEEDLVLFDRKTNYYKLIDKKGNLLRDSFPLFFICRDREAMIFYNRNDTLVSIPEKNIPLDASHLEYTCQSVENGLNICSKYRPLIQCGNSIPDRRPTFAGIFSNTGKPIVPFLVGATISYLPKNKLFVISFKEKKKKILLDNSGQVLFESNCFSISEKYFGWYGLPIGYVFLSDAYDDSKGVILNWKNGILFEHK